MGLIDGSAVVTTVLSNSLGFLEDFRPAIAVLLGLGLLAGFIAVVSRAWRGV